MSSWNNPQQPPVRICLFPIPNIPDIPPHRKHEVGVYTSGVLFAIGWWLFINALVQSIISQTSLGAEWAPGLALTLGMMIVNSIDQGSLLGDSYGQDDHTWKVRLAFFVGVAIMVGGFAGSIIVFLVKYQGPTDPFVGVSVIVQCILLVLSSVALWVAQNAEGEYHIALGTL